jgi:hypothetical protein
VLTPSFQEKKNIEAVCKVCCLSSKSGQKQKALATCYTNNDNNVTLLSFHSNSLASQFYRP